MTVTDFKLERYFAKYEFTTKYLLSSSDCDGYPLQYVLDCATVAEGKCMMKSNWSPDSHVRVDVCPEKNIYLKNKPFALLNSVLSRIA